MKTASVALCAAIAACAPVPYLADPALTQVSISVRWSTVEQIQKRCGFDKLACATYGTEALPFSTIWAERPLSFDDAGRVCTLGHELLHSLGARHE
jgi:hypothetical protein